MHTKLTLFNMHASLKADFHKAAGVKYGINYLPVL
jgi:hypothetical protein